MPHFDLAVVTGAFSYTGMYVRAYAGGRKRDEAALRTQ